MVLAGGLALVGLIGSGALSSERVIVESGGKELKVCVPQKQERVMKVMPRIEKKVEAPEALFDLELTEEQREELKELQTSFGEDMLELRLRLEVKQLELRILLLNDAPEQEQIDALVDEMGDVWAEVQKKNIALRMSLEDILTEEQLATLRKMRSMRSQAAKTGRNRAFSHSR